MGRSSPAPGAIERPRREAPAMLATRPLSPALGLEVLTCDLRTSLDTRVCCVAFRVLLERIARPNS